MTSLKAEVKSISQLSFTNCLTLVHAHVPCCAVKCCLLVNDCDLLAGFSDYPSPIWCLQWGGSPRAIRFIFSVGKLEWLGYNLVKVTWQLTQSFGHSTSTWQTDRPLRRHSKCRANALRREANTSLIATHAARRHHKRVGADMHGVLAGKLNSMYTVATRLTKG